MAALRFLEMDGNAATMFTVTQRATHWPWRGPKAMKYLNSIEWNITRLPCCQSGVDGKNTYPSSKAFALSLRAMA